MLDTRAGTACSFVATGKLALDRYNATASIGEPHAKACRLVSPRSQMRHILVILCIGTLHVDAFRSLALAPLPGQHRLQ